MLARHGFFSSAEDVFQLTHYEVKAAIIDLMTSCSSGSPPRGPAYWPDIVAERRAALVRGTRGVGYALAQAGIEIVFTKAPMILTGKPSVHAPVLAGIGELLACDPLSS